MSIGFMTVALAEVIAQNSKILDLYKSGSPELKGALAAESEKLGFAAGILPEDIARSTMRLLDDTAKEPQKSAELKAGQHVDAPIIAQTQSTDASRTV